VCPKDNLLHPVAYLSRSLIKAERYYAIFDKELLAIVAAFKEWRHYLEGNPHRLHAIVYTNHRNMESFMTTMQLTRRQARWAKTLGCFDFDIVFQPGHEAVRPDALSRCPDLALDKAKNLTFGQLLRPSNIRPDTFTAVAEFEACFFEERVDLENADYCFDVDVLGLDSIAVLSCPTKPSLLDQDPLRDARQLDEGVCTPKIILGDSVPELNSTLAPLQFDSVLHSLVPVSAGQPSPPLDIWTDSEMIEGVRRAGPEDSNYTALMNLVKSPTSRRLYPKLSHYTVANNLLYHRHRVVVPQDSKLQCQIVRSHHDSRLASHPGRAKTLSLVQRSFTWTSIKQMVNQYVDGCESCQRTKACTQKPLGLLEPLPIPAGPRTDISYDLIMDLPISEGCDSILTVVDRLTKMAHLLPCSKTLNAEGLARLMLRNAWKLHGTPKTIVLDCGLVFISQITRKLD
jgi:hypothetical protein